MTLHGRGIRTEKETDRKRRREAALTRRNGEREEQRGGNGNEKGREGRLEGQAVRHIEPVKEKSREVEMV